MNLSGEVTAEGKVLLQRMNEVGPNCTAETKLRTRQSPVALVGKIDLPFYPMKQLESRNEPGAYMLL
jgi:hypothetical protein